MGNTAVDFFIKEVSVFTGQTLVTVAPKAGLAIGGTLSASLLVGVVVAGGATGDTDPGCGMRGKEGSSMRESVRLEAQRTVGLSLKTLFNPLW